MRPQFAYKLHNSRKTLLVRRNMKEDDQRFGYIVHSQVALKVLLFAALSVFYRISMRVDIFCSSEHFSESSFLSIILRTLRPYNLRTLHESEEVFALTAKLSKHLRLRYTAGSAAHSYAISFQRNQCELERLSRFKSIFGTKESMFDEKSTSRWCSPRS